MTEAARDRSARRVLMVLYFFPPLGGVGMSRNLRNSQYLPRYGWLPIVLTSRDPAYRIRDEGAVGLIDPQTTVIRTRSIEAAHIQGWLRAVRGRRPASSAPVTPAAQPAAPRPAATPGVLARLRRAAFFPDDQVGWLHFAVSDAVRAHRARPYDAIFSTSSPVTSHLIAGFVKWRTGVPWVAEFRDPWVGNVIGAHPSPTIRRLQRVVERWIVRHADEIVCVTPRLARMYRDRYPDARVTLITNGYDRTETVAPRERDSSRFRIVFTGTLDRPAELRTFLEGLERLVARRPELLERLEVVSYGLVSEECRAVVDNQRDGWPLRRILTFAGYVPRTEAAAAVADADAALVLLGEGPGMDLFIGGKLYDYLGQDQQILAMVPDGDARDVLTGLDWGVLASPDPASVELAVERLVDSPRPDRPADPEGRYDRAVLAGRLAECLDRAVEGRDDEHGASVSR